jgi:hypothetical protein
MNHAKAQPRIKVLQLDGIMAEHHIEYSLQQRTFTLFGFDQLRAGFFIACLSQALITGKSRCSTPSMALKMLIF